MIRGIRREWARSGAGTCAVACALLLAAASRVHARGAPLVPPRLVTGQSAGVAYPEQAGGARARVVVELLVGADGRVEAARGVEIDLQPEGADPAPFVQGAEQQARSLVFEPALRDREPVPSRIRFEFRFAPDLGAPARDPARSELPAHMAPPTRVGEAPLEGATPDTRPASSPGDHPPPDAANAGAGPAPQGTRPAPDGPALAPDQAPGTPSGADGAAAPAGPPLPAPGDDRAATFGARAQLTRSPPPAAASAASDIDLSLNALRDVPRRSAADYLTLAPGVVLTNHSGVGHAGGMFLRGFDAGEGQDFELRVDGIPINEPSNAHAHGYADTQFVIPEVIDRIRVLQGPFDPRQSDFAVAGSAHYVLGVAKRGLRAQLGYGRFAERRALLLWAPTHADRGTFAAVDLRAGDGFGPNRAHSSMSALARYAGRAGSLDYAVLLGSHALTFDSAGVIREDSFAARELPCDRDPDRQFFCVSDPQQGGAASRQLLGAKLGWRRPDRSFELQAYGMLRDLRLRENFTGASLDARGDGLDESYEATTVGMRASYVTSPELWRLRQRFELGIDARHDDATSRMLRIRRTGGIPYAPLFDTELSLTHLAAYGRVELNPIPALSLRGGLRLDGFAFRAVEAAGPTQDRAGERLPLSARDAFGSAVSPRGSIVARVHPSLAWTLSAGLGVRSSDAQALSEGEAAPFVRVLALETGPTARAVGPGDLRLEARAFAFATRVASDLLFDPERGRNVPVGPSNRYGASASIRAGFGTRHDSLASFTWTEAHSIGRSDGILALGSGPRLPFVPRWVARFDHASNAELRLGDERLRLSAAAGIGWVGARPLPLGSESEVHFQVDLGLGARWRFLELGLAVENLLDRRNRAAELHYASHFGPASEPASMRSVRHFAAGEPRLWMLTLTAHVDDIALVQGDGP